MVLNRKRSSRGEVPVEDASDLGGRGVNEVTSTFYGFLGGRKRGGQDFAVEESAD